MAAKVKLPQPKSKYEEEMAIILRSMGLEFEREYRFHNKRKWLADFYIPTLNLLVEVEGGVYDGGRHTRGKGYTEDCEKYNAAILRGYRLLRFTSWMVGAKARDTLLELIRREEHAEAGEAYKEEEDDEQADRRRPRSGRPPLPT